jgi:hypothetical protein
VMRFFIWIKGSCYGTMLRYKKYNSIDNICRNEYNIIIRVNTRLEVMSGDSR